MSIRRHFLRERRRLVKRRTNIDLIRLFATFLFLHGFEIEVPHGLFRHVDAIDQYLAVTIGSEPFCSASRRMVFLLRAPLGRAIFKSENFFR